MTHPVTEKHTAVDSNKADEEQRNMKLMQIVEYFVH
jgi:hypothetical protein